MANIIEKKETLDLCDTWRTRNCKSKRFTFYQNHISDPIQRKLGYFLISNILQETAIRADVLASFWSNHSPIIFSILFESNNKRRKGLWKFNKSLFSNEEYINKLRNHISESLRILDQSGIRVYEIRWEFIKFKIRLFSISLSNNVSKSLNAKREFLEKKLNDFEKSGSSYFDNEDYLACKKT